MLASIEDIVISWEGTIAQVIVFQERPDILDGLSSGLAERYPDWPGLIGIAEITAHRINKRTGHTSTQTRYYITSLPPNPETLLAASRAHWSIENNLHWQLDVAFREDDNRTRADQAPQNLAIMRRIVLNIIKRDSSKPAVKRKRLIAGMDRQYRVHITSY